MRIGSMGRPPADLPTPHTAVPNWAPGDTIDRGAGQTVLVVVEIRADEGGEPVLVVKLT